MKNLPSDVIERTLISQFINAFSEREKGKKTHRSVRRSKASRISLVGSWFDQSITLSQHCLQFADRMLIAYSIDLGARLVY